ncbi:MAG: hypothetical protein M4579_000109 [Chaenotheca gracillima]|nr:MAG: hypothetical protein M4579_000109 [Chaenotheca gracillima]
MALPSSTREGLALLTREERRSNPNVTSIINDLKTSELFRNNWDDILQSTLKSNLEGANSAGVASFQKIGPLMSKINQVARETQDSIKRVAIVLQHEDVEVDVIDYSLKSLRREAEITRASAREAKESMDSWLKQLSELYAICSKDSASAETRQQILELAEQAERDRVLADSSMKEQLMTMENQLREYSEEYKRALNEFPINVDLVGESIRFGLLEASGSAITVGIDGPAPQSTVPKMVRALSGEAKKAMGGSAPTTSSDKAINAVERRKSLLSELGSVLTSKDQVAADKFNGEFYLNDPALGSIASVKTYVGGLKDIICTPDGVDWDATVKRTGVQPTTLSLLSALSGGLERRMKGNSTKNDGLASQLLVYLMTEASAVAKELTAEVEGQRKPGKDSEVVLKWVSRITDCALIAQHLHAASKATPGAFLPNVPSLATPGDSTEAKIGKMNLKPVAAEQVVKAASAKMATARAAYSATLETYRKASAASLETQVNLSKARAEIELIKASTFNLNNFAAVLVNCIGFCLAANAKFELLSQVSGNISLIAESVSQNHVRTFQEKLESFKKTSQDSAKVQSYNEYLRNVIFGFTVQIASKFALCRELTTTYGEVNNRCFQPGIAMLEDMSRSSQYGDGDGDGGRLAAMKRRISEFSSHSERDIRGIVQKTQQERIEELETRVRTISETIEKFPGEVRPNDSTMVSIKTGTAFVQFFAEDSVIGAVSGLELAGADTGHCMIGIAR